MKKNLSLFVLLGVLTLLLFQSCQDDPIFPDPGFEITEQRVEVRRDTADFYNIHMSMKVPNKVKEIVLLDGLDYSLIETIEGYNGKSNFDLDYIVDLTSILEDTVLNYIIKVTDLDGRTFNRGIRISVKRFSFPEIRLVGGNNIAVAAPAFNLKGLITTGLNTVQSVRVVYQGEVQYSFNAAPGEELHEMTLEALIFVGLLEEGQVYPIQIIISDNKGQESTTIVNVRKSASIKKPIRILYTNYLNGQIEITPTYDAKDRLISFAYKFVSGVVYFAEMEYNDLDMVTKYTYTSFTSSGTFSRKTVYTFNYIAGTKQLIDIKSQFFNYDTAGNLTSSGAVVTESSNFVYDGATTKVLSFRTTSVVNNIYYSDPFNLGESIYGDFFQLQSYMGSNTIRRQHFEGYDPVLIPTYNEGLPPFFDASSSVLFGVFQDLLYNKYIMTKTVPTDPAYSDTYLWKTSYNYEADEEGNITTISKIFTDGSFAYKGKTELYAFFY